MIRKLTEKLTTDDLRDEIVFTRSMINAHPLTQHLVGHADQWDAELPAFESRQRAQRDLRITLDARRQISNEFLGRTVLAFSDDLLRFVNKDRTSKLYTQYFSVPPSKFVGQALGEEVAAVRSWLPNEQPLLDPHRAELSRWTDTADAVLAEDKRALQLTAELQQARERIVADLTAKRDALWAILAELARQHHLGRTWANSFFRKG
jgi:hypothetical protein